MLQNKDRSSDIETVVACGGLLSARGGLLSARGGLLDPALSIYHKSSTRKHRSWLS
jgi:hypothetical protein